jgi:hypothetical protein
MCAISVVRSHCFGGVAGVTPTSSAARGNSWLPHIAGSTGNPLAVRPCSFEGIALTTELWKTLMVAIGSAEGTRRANPNRG